MRNISTLDSLIDINGQQLNVLHIKPFTGRPTIVFLHDSLGSIQLWRDFPQKLAEASGYNLLVYDRLGYGRSAAMPSPHRELDYLKKEADILNALLKKLKIDDAILFGHSDGGSIALITAAKYKERITAVVSEAAHLFAEDVTIRGIKDAMEAYRTTDLKQRLEKYHGDNVEFLFRAWTETWTHPDFLNWNIEHFLPKIACPVLVVQGDADGYGTLLQVEKTVTQVSGSTEKFILPGIGHTPHKEAPDAVMHRVVEFLISLGQRL